MSHSGEHQAAEIARSRIVDQAKYIKDRRHRLYLIIIAILLLALLLTSAGFAFLAYARMTSSAQAGVNLAQQLQDACAKRPVKTADGRDLCAKADKVVKDAPAATVGPKGDNGDPGVPGEVGPGPTNAQVANAVALYCLGGRCKGAAGNDVTPAQVAAAVSSYCDANGKCKGPTGTTGNDGTNGTDGKDGAQGPGPTDAQIASSVDSYCSSHDNCKGPTGDTGATGVVDVNSDCDAPDGKVVDQVNATYSEDSKTINITCTYKDDASVVPGP